MTLRLYPLPSLFDQDVALLKSATPVMTSSFYMRRPHAVAWSVDPTTFILETDEPTVPHEIVVNLTDKIRVVPGVSPYSLQLQLAKGSNRIDVSTATQSMYITVAATAIETWFRALGREHYLAVSRRFRDIQNHFLTPWTTRIAAHLLSYADLFLHARMPKIQQTRFAIMTSMGGRLGHGDGVVAMASALSYSTPVVTKVQDAEFAVPGRHRLYPGVTAHPTTGEFTGRLFDLWYPNQCLAARDALIRMSLNVGAADVPAPKPLQLVDFNDLCVLLKFAGGETETHHLDALSAECSDIEFGTECDPLRAIASVEATIDMLMMTPQLPFDEVVENPINFGFWDMGFALDESTGSTEPGLGGDAEFDTVDPDDPFGTGFEGVSLSRRLDGSACFDSRIQPVGRLAKFVPPLASSSSLTPGDYAAGDPFVIDAKAGAPAPSIGNSIVWGISAQNFIYEGDYLRFEEPDAEIQVTSAWPVFPGVDYIVKSFDTAASGTVGTQKIITASTGFFEQKHKGMGVRVAGSALYSIVAVNETGTQAVVVGNPTALPGGTFIINVYEPLRDRNQTAFLAGRRTYEVTLASALLETHADGAITDHRISPRVIGAHSGGATLLTISTDVYPRPGDLIYLTAVSSRVIEHTELISTHHTSGLATYRLRLTSGLPGALTDNQALYAVRAEPCFDSGDPVTPLMLFSYGPPTYLMSAVTGVTYNDAGVTYNDAGVTYDGI